MNNSIVTNDGSLELPYRYLKDNPTEFKACTKCGFVVKVVSAENAVCINCGNGKTTKVFDFAMFHEAQKQEVLTDGNLDDTIKLYVV